MKALYFSSLFLCLSLALFTAALYSPACAADSKNLPKINVGQSKQEVEKLMGPAESTKTFNGIKMYHWNLKGNPNSISLDIAYNAKNSVVLRTLYGRGSFQAEVKDATAHFGPPATSGKDEAMWKLKSNEYLILRNETKGVVSFTIAIKDIAMKIKHP
jgi:hypothetical protein